jgi:hypothetical protein
MSFTSKDSVVVNYYQDWELNPELGIWRPIEDSRNLALSKTATASSTTGGNVASNATAPSTWRNYLNTKWVSAPTDNEWLQVDLGSPMEINRVILKWDSSYAESFKIQTSTDATLWTDVFSTTTGRARSVTDETFATTQARYVRMLGETRGTSQGYSLYQFMVLNDSLPPVSNFAPGQAKLATRATLSYGEGRVHYNLPSGHLITLEAWDAQGKRAAVIDAGYRLAGKHSTSIPHSLAAGHYLLRLTVGTQLAATLKHLQP